jgi:hypothetical protein
MKEIAKRLICHALSLMFPPVIDNEYLPCDDQNFVHSTTLVAVMRQGNELVEVDRTFNTLRVRG